MTQVIKILNESDDSMTQVIKISHESGDSMIRLMTRESPSHRVMTCEQSRLLLFRRPTQKVSWRPMFPSNSN